MKRIITGMIAIGLTFLSTAGWKSTLRAMKKFRIGNISFEAELSGESFNTFKIKM